MRTPLKIVSLLSMLGLVFAVSAHAETWRWNANTEADLAGYRAYEAPGACTNPGPFALVGTFPRTATTGTTPVSPDGTYCGRMTAFDNATPPNESLFSATAQVSINLNPPVAPTGFLLSAP